MASDKRDIKAAWWVLAGLAVIVMQIVIRVMDDDSSADRCDRVMEEFNTLVAQRDGMAARALIPGSGQGAAADALRRTERDYQEKYWDLRSEGEGRCSDQLVLVRDRFQRTDARRSPMPSQASGGAGAGIRVGAGVRVVAKQGERLECLNIRSGPSMSATIDRCIPPGTTATVSDGPRSADGYRWWLLKSDSWSGWARGEYLQHVGGG